MEEGDEVADGDDVDDEESSDISNTQSLRMDSREERRSVFSWCCVTMSTVARA